MITALDANVLLDILIPNQMYAAAALALMDDAAAAGSIVVSDVASAETAVHFVSQPDFDRFFESNGIRIEPLHRETLFFASRIYRK